MLLISTTQTKTMSIQMAPKLTDKYITLPPFAAMRVNLVAQILSHSVAAGINTLCNLGNLPDEASSMAEFVETFDQLLNTFNSAQSRSSDKYKHALNDNSGHIPFLNSCVKIFVQVENWSKYCCSMYSWLADINNKFD